MKQKNKLVLVSGANKGIGEAFIDKYSVQNQTKTIGIRLVKRVSIFSNQASNLIKLNINDNQLVVSAQDIDFSISAVERLNCEYEGDEMDIGFKSTFLQEILSNISTSDVKVELSDPTRAGLLLPSQDGDESEEMLMLLMPMMINA